MVTDVLGTYTFRLSDGYVWNARRMKKWIRIRPQTEEQMPDDDTPAPAPQDTPEKPLDAEEAGEIWL